MDAEELFEIGDGEDLADVGVAVHQVHFRVVAAGVVPLAKRGEFHAPVLSLLAVAGARKVQLMRAEAQIAAALQWKLLDGFLPAAAGAGGAGSPCAAC